ncbi:phosphatase PAP2 family protein [Magnetospira thiophila]
MKTLWRLARRAPLRMSLLLLGVTAGLSIALWDQDVAHFYKTQADPDLVAFLASITDLGKPEAWFVLAAVGLLISKWRLYFVVESAARAWWTKVGDAAAFVAMSLALSGVLVNLLKLLFSRHRPRDLFEQGVSGFNLFGFDSALHSFPSGHTQVAVALAACLVVILPRFDHLFVAFALLIGFTRFGTSVHYFSDVLIGAWVGLVVPVWLLRSVYARRGIDLRFGPRAGLLVRLRDHLDGWAGVTCAAAESSYTARPSDPRKQEEQG